MTKNKIKKQIKWWKHWENTIIHDASIKEQKKLERIYNRKRSRQNKKNKSK